MQTKTLTNPLWSTASFEEATDSLPMELSALGQHVDRCRGARGRWFALHSAAERLNGFVAQRFVTTLVVVTLLIAAGLAVF